MDILHRLGISPNSLSGQVALITGAARGIGEHTALAMARAGARVVLLDIAGGGATVSQRILEAGGTSCFVQGDVGEPADIRRAVEQAQALFGPVDILINNAARLRTGSVAHSPLAEWDESYQTNLRGPLTAIREVLPGMLARRHGVIASLISLEGMPFLGAYCANKMALRSMMLSLGKEITADQGVSIFSVVPGSVDTPLIHELAATFSAAMNVPVEQVMASLANNPGYPGLVPVEHTAAALTWFAAHAPQFHGQFVDGYLPLSLAGVIDVAGPSTTAQPERHGVHARLPNPEIELDDLVRINRSLENRIAERTRELTRLAAELEAKSRALEEASLRYEVMANTDALTGLPNRRKASERLEAAWREAETPDAPLACILLDGDDFKAVNDAHGHGAGDLVLNAIARRIQQSVREGDLACRLGGDEFLVICPGASVSTANEISERIREAVAALRVQLGDAVWHGTLSAGIAIRQPGLATADEMLRLADHALYEAKRAGGNRTQAPKGSALCGAPDGVSSHTTGTGGAGAGKLPNPSVA